MRRERLRYIIGYCMAMLTIALVLIRTGDLQERSGMGTTGKTPEVLEVPVTADGEQVIKPAYQALYPDMYVTEEAQVTSGTMLEEERRLYLTFDDGPSKVTEDVVEALEEADARAAFFLIGNKITADQEELVRQMAAEGHIIGVHTYSHQYKEIYGSVESFLEDFHKTYERIFEVTGEQPVYFRFPWGSVNCYNKEIREELIREMERRGFRYFDWNVSAEDSVGNPTEYSVLHNVVDAFPRYRKAVVLMHDSATNEISARVLPQILAAAKSAGYQFGTLDQLEEPYQWSNSY